MTCLMNYDNYTAFIYYIPRTYSEVLRPEFILKWKKNILLYLKNLWK